MGGYAGWSTAGKTIGTCIARAVIEHAWPDINTRVANLNFWLVDDWAYQTIVRTRMAKPPLPDQAVRILNVALRELAGNQAPVVRSTRFPWSRTFEIEIELEGYPAKKLTSESVRRSQE